MTQSPNNCSVHVSIIIVAYRAWDKLLPCLQSLQTDPFPHEVIVVDNANEIEQQKLAQENFPNVKFVSNEGNYGFAHGCNTGALLANSDVLLFLNPDTLISIPVLEHMVRELESLPDYSIVAANKQNPKGKSERIARFFPSLLTLTGPGKALHRQLNQTQIKQRFNPDAKVVFPDWVSGSVVMIRRFDFHQLGGWDSQFWMYSEDVDLCYRATKAGGKVALLKDCSIIHDHGGSSRINPEVSALTKSEVMISHHVYIQLHYSGVKNWLAHILLIGTDSISALFWAFIAVFLWTNPKAITRRLILKNLFRYYLQSLQQKSWLSPRSQGKETRITLYNKPRCAKDTATPSPITK